MKKILPPVILLFLSPAIGELLSGSAPPAEFFSPFGLTALTILYGGGAVLIRELVVRWNKGWTSLFILGSAYGIIEEGLMVKSFFDPNWVDLGILGSYGRIGGVNWVWSVELTIYHGIISIAVPIVLVEILIPDRRNDAWLNRGWLIVLSILFILDVLIGHFFMTAYRPGAKSLILTTATVAGLVLLAWRLPHRERTVSDRQVKPPVLFWLIGFFGTLGFFIIFTALANTNIPPFLTILIGCLWVTGCGMLVLRVSGGGWDDRHQFALAAGILCLFVLFAPIREFSRGQTDNPAGMTIVGAVTLALLVLLWLTIKRRSRDGIHQ